MNLRGKHCRTLNAVFNYPISGNIRWQDIEALVNALGGDVNPSKGGGSRVHFVLRNVPATFHRPHPRPVLGKKSVVQFRRYLITAGVMPGDYK
jgi:hypothetical protein